MTMQKSSNMRCGTLTCFLFNREGGELSTLPEPTVFRSSVLLLLDDVSECGDVAEQSLTGELDAAVSSSALDIGLLKITFS